MQRMTIYGVSFDMVGKQPIVLLKTVDSNKFLPIWIGHPEAAVSAITETLAGAFGREVRVRPSSGGYRVELELSTIEEAAALAGRLGHASGATLRSPEGD